MLHTILYSVNVNQNICCCSIAEHSSLTHLFHLKKIFKVSFDLLQLWKVWIYLKSGFHVVTLLNSVNYFCFHNPPKDTGLLHPAIIYISFFSSSTSLSLIAWLCFSIFCSSVQMFQIATNGMNTKNIPPINISKIVNSPMCISF